MQVKKHIDAEVPARSNLVGWAEFVQLTEVHPTRLGELIELSWIEPVTTEAGAYLFRSRDVYRLRKLERLRRDLDINDAGASIIVDLLERIERLEAKVREMERLL